RGLVLAQPKELRRGEARQGAVAGELDQALQADGLLDVLALRRRALVVPKDRRPHDPVGLVEGDQPVHLARQPDAAHLVAGGALPQRPPPRGRGTPPPVRLRRPATSPPDPARTTRVWVLTADSRGRRARRPR